MLKQATVKLHQGMGSIVPNIFHYRGWTREVDSYHARGHHPRDHETDSRLYEMDMSQVVAVPFYEKDLAGYVRDGDVQIGSKDGEWFVVNPAKGEPLEPMDAADILAGRMVFARASGSSGCAAWGGMVPVYVAELEAAIAQGPEAYFFRAMHEIEEREFFYHVRIDGTWAEYKAYRRSRWVQEATC